MQLCTCNLHALWIHELMYCICVCLCVIVGFQFGLKFVLSDSINKFVLSRYVLTSIVQNVEGWSPSCYKKSQNRLDDALPFNHVKITHGGTYSSRYSHCWWIDHVIEQGLVNVPWLGDFKHHFQVSVGDYIPNIGWYSIRTFTSPCWIQLLYSYILLYVCCFLNVIDFPIPPIVEKCVSSYSHRISTNDSSSYCHLVVFRLLLVIPLIGICWLSFPSFCTIQTYHRDIPLQAIIVNVQHS